MVLSRSSPLLTTAAEVTDLTGAQDLGNLETGAEFSVADHLLRAHEWVFDRLEQRFGAEAVLLVTNTSRLERAVAYRFLEVLAAGGYLGDSGARAADEGVRGYWGQQAREEVERFRPVFSDEADQPRNTGEALPSVTNMFAGSSAVVDGPLFSV